MALVMLQAVDDGRSIVALLIVSPHATGLAPLHADDEIDVTNLINMTNACVCACFFFWFFFLGGFVLLCFVVFTHKKKA